MGETVKLTAADGHELDAYAAKPPGAAKGAIVVVMEIFGVNSHIREVADGYAREGYLAVAPAFLDRVERGIELGYTPDDIGTARGIIGKLKWDDTVADLTAAADYAAEHGRGREHVGVVGYCWGGTVAFLATTRLGLPASSYYGGRTEEFAEEHTKAPLIMHFGEKDAMIPMEFVTRLGGLHPDADIHIYDADHGFNCDQRGSYDKKSADTALKLTLAFFEEHVAKPG